MLLLLVLFAHYLPFCRAQQLKYRMNLYKLREERDMKPITFGHMVSSALYEKRLVVPAFYQNQPVGDFVLTPLPSYLCGPQIRPLVC